MSLIATIPDDLPICNASTPITSGTLGHTCPRLNSRLLVFVSGGVSVDPAPAEGAGSAVARGTYLPTSRGAAGLLTSSTRKPSDIQVEKSKRLPKRRANCGE